MAGLFFQPLRLRVAARSAGTRRFWQWVNFVFNRVDHSRVREVGPDRAAAEWVLRLGGSVKFCSTDHWTRDYNRLPSEPRETLHLEASRCKFLHDDGLMHLAHVKDTLKQFDISHCHGISDAGLQSLYILKFLVSLNIFDTPGVKHRVDSILKLRNALPSCNITS